jgi:hypothetical protein
MKKLAMALMLSSILAAPASAGGNMWTGGCKPHWNPIYWMEWIENNIIL